MFVILVQEACDCAKRRETKKKKNSMDSILLYTLIQNFYHDFISFHSTCTQTYIHGLKAPSRLKSWTNLSY